MEKLIRIFAYFLFLISIPLSSALKLDILAHPGHEAKSKERCIRNFVAKDQLVLITAIVDGHSGDGQQLNMHVRAPLLSSIARLRANKRRSAMPLAMIIRDQEI
jgi:hypothetical protein